MTPTSSRLCRASVHVASGNRGHVEPVTSESDTAGIPSLNAATTSSRSLAAARGRKTMKPRMLPLILVRDWTPKMKPSPTRTWPTSGDIPSSIGTMATMFILSTLSQIHRHLLNHEPSAFYGLFSLPGCAEGTIEGKDDALPIRLVGDNVDEIAAFLGYAYSSPLDLQYGRIPPGEISNLMKTAKFTHKYRLDSFEKWAVKAIINVCAKGSWALLQACLPEVCLTLLELDLLCPMPPVKAAVRTQWVARIRNDDPAVTLTYALETADKFLIWALQGDVYYIQLQALVDPLSAIANVDAACTLPDKLSDLHKLRLLMGFRSLALAWGRISANPFVLNAAICPHGPDFHLNSWEEEWRHTVDDTGGKSPRT
ncbi:hypothetical protein DFH09DRAFT_1325556 [Mycena vulgaris]|nr:hypothetical protein DFH09DRAFT_1325556 [Mycena vulgaris]